MSKSFSFLLSFSMLLGACTGESLSEQTPDPTSSPEVPTVIEEAEPVLEVALIALEDNGMSGPLVGCGDSVVSVFQEGDFSAIPEARIRQALSALFAIEDEYYGESGLYNALYQADLRVSSVEKDSSSITVNLEGTLLSGGMCDDPRIKEQIYQTILENSGMPTETSVQVFINGKDLETLLNGKGE